MICENCNAHEVMPKKDGTPSRFCSPKCRSEFIIAARKKTNLQKYGFETAMKSDRVIEKRNATNLAKYGVQNVFNNPAVRQKGKDTCIKKFGVEHACQNPTVKEKIRAAWVGYDGGHPFADPKIREKREATLIEKFGVKHPILNDEIRNKIYNTNLFKYGEIVASKSSEVKQKISSAHLSPAVKEKTKQTSMVKFGVEFYNQQAIANQILLLQDEQWLIDQVSNLGFVGVASALGVSVDTVRKYANMFHISPPSKSSFELQVYEFIAEKFKGVIICNERLCDNKEIDIYLPEQHLAIECNGSYWHSELNGRDKNYHINKTIELNKIGVHLVHIWEDEWNNKQEIVKSRLQSLLAINETMYARKCNVSIISSSTAAEFLSQNHIQGSCQSTIRIGLFNNGNLVAVMTFGKSRFNKSVEYELLRFVSLRGVNVVGGASKLLTYFKILYSPESIISYSDKSFNRGSMYGVLGFTKMSSAPPAYYYTKNYKEFFNRVKFQKHKLPKLLTAFDPALSEWENMKLNGYDRIWDCGTDVWLWNSPNQSN